MDLSLSMAKQIHGFLGAAAWVLPMATLPLAAAATEPGTLASPQIGARYEYLCTGGSKQVVTIKEVTADEVRIEVSDAAGQADWRYDAGLVVPSLQTYWKAASGVATAYKRPQDFVDKLKNAARLAPSGPITSAVTVKQINMRSGHAWETFEVLQQATFDSETYGQVTVWPMRVKYVNSYGWYRETISYYAPDLGTYVGWLYTEKNKPDSTCALIDFHVPG